MGNAILYTKEKPSLEDVEMRQCGTCGEFQFSFCFDKQKNSFKSYCKACTRKVSRKHYLANKERYVARNTKLREDRKKWYRDVKSHYSCSICGESHISCIEFHHIDPSNKVGEVSTMATSSPKKAVLEEIAKCEVLCANCHRKRHHPIP